MIILGIDPGLAIVGFGVLEKNKNIGYNWLDKNVIIYLRRIFL